MTRLMSYVTRFTFYVLIALVALVSLNGVNGAQAQENTPRTVDSLDTNLARAAAKSFLTTLTRPELAGTMNFYLTDDVKDSAILAGLQNPLVSSFEITAASWATDQTFQVQATLQPDDRQVNVYVGKYNGR